MMENTCEPLSAKINASTRNSTNRSQFFSTKSKFDERVL